MRVIVFDLDNTLIRGNISFKFFFFLLKKKKISFFKLLYPLAKFLKYQLGFLSLVDMHNLVFENFLKNQNLRFFKNHVNNFLKEKINKIINKPVYRHLNHFLAKKDHVILMSSSPIFLVGPLAKMLNIKNSFATRYLLGSSDEIIDVDYFLEGHLKAKFLADHLKVNKLDYDMIIGFSDSIDDLPLLEKCNEVYLVNPNRKLIKRFVGRSCKII